MADPVPAYRGLSAFDLESEYSPSLHIEGGVDPWIARYVSESAGARAACRIHEDIAYGGGPAQKLDLFLPEAQERVPLHVFLHGGYWQELSHKESAVMARALTKCGIALAVVNYTLAPAAPLEQMVIECAGALDWLAGNAGGLGVDAGNLTVSGHSAGAHLAAMLLSEGWPEGSPWPVSAMLLISGIYDLEPIRHTYINEPLGLTAHTANTMSPIKLPPRNRCPVRAVVGALETEEFRRQSIDYADYLKGRGLDATCKVMAGLHHFDILCAPQVIGEITALHGLPPAEG